MTLASLRSRAPLVLVALALAILALAKPALSFAHEQRTVATDYTFTVGFISEPAIQGDTNGLWLKVVKGDQPVVGLADTLKAEAIYGDQKRELTLTPAFGEKGVYTSVFIPMEPGDYTFHIFGKIENANVDESFTSSPEGFDSVAKRTDYEFPSNANGSSSSSTLAYPAAIGGVVLAAGVAGLLARRTRR